MSGLQTTVEGELHEINTALNDSGRSALWSIARGVRRGTVNKGLLLGLTILALDVLAVSHFQPTVALSILRSSPPLSVLVGAMVNLLPPIAFTLSTALIAMCTLSVARHRTQQALGEFAATIAVLFTGWAFLDHALMPSIWTVAGVWLVSALGAVGVHLLQERSDGSQDIAGVFRLFVVLVAGLNLLTSPSVRESLARPYLPSEELAIAAVDGQVTTIGYVLDVDQSGQWTTILTEQERQITIIASENLLERSVCALAGQGKYEPLQPVIDAAGDEGTPMCSAQN